jgi:hypothetical protein
MIAVKCVQKIKPAKENNDSSRLTGMKIISGVYF